MKNSNLTKGILMTVSLLFIIISPSLEAQTKKIKRPRNNVGISSVDKFVRESFDLYDKVYMYDGYAAAGTSLEDEDIDVLEDALEDLSGLSESAPDIISDLDGQGAIKQMKATSQINRAKKALTYSVKTAKELLFSQQEGETESEQENEMMEEAESSGSHNENPSNKSEAEEVAEDSNISDDLEAISKFDFVPGDKIIYYDDFSQDFIGDFPSKWNTNGTGEVVQFNNIEGKWFQIKSGYGISYLPLVDAPLPEDYTIEFDLLVNGIDKKTSSTAMLRIILGDNNGFKDGNDHAFTGLPLGQYGAFNIRVANRNKGPNQINSTLQTDIRKAILNKPHISIAVNDKRFRLWINEKKYVDIPQFIYAPETIKYLKFNVKSLKDGKEKLFISNVKIAEGGVDLRRKLMSEGRISTNGILFDSGSANIKPQSYGIIRQISQVLMQDGSMKLNIIGHTDSDGSDDTNMKLSEDRAKAVRTALINVYNIDASRLTSEGKGKSDPVADNSTTDGKAQNRRVEFVKI